MKRLIKWISLTLLSLFVIVAGLIVYINSIFKNESKKYVYKEYVIEKVDSNTICIGNNWLRQEQHGLYTLYIEGKPFERGFFAGRLTQPLILKQELTFVKQLKKIVRSKYYLTFLKFLIAIFDLKLYQSIPNESKAEIYGLSLSASDSFNYIATNYQRILNYQAAHDLGHMLSNMGMVGCTSFGIWNEKTPDGNLLIGRNFDFYISEEFAEDKIVAFVNPDSGYFHSFITWGGMMGAVSGMNEKGLTVTINAANSDINIKAATPVSIVARQILQYAADIEEAVKIASKFDIFVSELFLIGSAADNKAVIIEKRPGSQIVFTEDDNYIISTNHFQSVQNGFSVKSKEQQSNTASDYRFERVKECLSSQNRFNASDLINILRDTLGINNTSIGLGNEKAINQLIGHHSIIFYPKERIFWVSTSPYQVGHFVGYNLKEIAANKKLEPNFNTLIDSMYIKPDEAFLAHAFPRYELYLELSKKNLVHEIDAKGIKLLISLNPNYYNAYVQAGDYYVNCNQSALALTFYSKALSCIIPSEKEYDRINEKFTNCRKKLVSQ